MNCHICDQEFNSYRSLSAHLSNKNSNCNTDIKTYYDKFLRKIDEGKCLICNCETMFAGISRGYPNNYCKHHKNCNPSGKEKRSIEKLLRDKTKKLNHEYLDKPIYCEICKIDNKDTRFNTISGLARHIIQLHREIVLIDYYDQYLMRELSEEVEINGNILKL